MAEPGGVVTATLLAHSPAPCPALDAILADDEHSLPSSNDQPLPDGRVQQSPLDYSRAALRFHLREKNAHMAVEGDMYIYYVGRDLENYVESSLRAIAAVHDRDEAYAQRDAAEAEREAATVERDTPKAQLAEAEAALRRRTSQTAE